MLDFINRSTDYIAARAPLFMLVAALVTAGLIARQEAVRRKARRQVKYINSAALIQSWVRKEQ